MPSESQLGGRFAPVRTLADFLAVTGLCFDDGDSSGPGGAASSLVASRPGEPSMIWGRHFSSFRTVPALSVARATGDAATAWKRADDNDPFKIGLGAERAGLRTRCNQSPAIMRAKLMAGQELPDQEDCWTGAGTRQRARRAGSGHNRYLSGDPGDGPRTSRSRKVAREATLDSRAGGMAHGIPRHHVHSRSGRGI
jgi:hypothetical protein